MNTPRSDASFYSLLALAFVIGFGVASGAYFLLLTPNAENQSAKVNPSITPETLEDAEFEQNVSKESLDSSSPPLSPIRSLDDLEQIKSAFERSVVFRNLLASSDEATVAQLLAQSKDPGRDEMQMAIVQRFAQLNPKRTLSQVLEMESQSFWPGQFVASIFREWAHSNLDEAVAHARTIDNDWKESVLRAIVAERKDLSENVLRSIARDLGNEQAAIAVITAQKIENALDNPEKAWNEIAIDLQDDTQLAWSIARVASAWIEKDGLGVMDQVIQSLTNLESRRIVTSYVLSEVAETDPAAAYTYALTIENDPYNSTIQGIMRNWARSDPEAALTAASEVQKKSLRTELERTVVWTWAYDKPRELLEGIDVLPEHTHSAAFSTALGKIADDSPMEAAGIVAGMESGPQKISAASSVANAWMYNDHKAALSWILNEPAVKEIKPQMLSGALHRLAQIDPQLAMDTALAQPIDESGGTTDKGVGMELQVISNLAYSDLDTAIELLPQVREGLTKLHAYKNVSGALIRDGEIEEALDMDRQLPESDRTEFYMSVVGAWSGVDPEQLLNSMNRFQSREVKSRAAMMILSSNRFHKNLSEEQVEKANSFLTDKDAKALEEGEANVYRQW
ncbi:MAG: hypothetical protein OXG24_03010 [Gammaproteobacteria bacterium]|nr:hypothetical protein [Gammaproteobacteria bacterium]